MNISNARPGSSGEKVPIKSPINFFIAHNERVPKKLSRNECKIACIADDGYFKEVEMDDDQKSDEEIARCIKTLVGERYATCGETLESAEKRTDKIFSLLKTYEFTPYELVRMLTTDPAAACETQGWAQGKDDSDCWIDSFLFSIFTNSLIAPIIIEDMTNKYKTTVASTEQKDIYMNKAIFSINLYLNLLRERKALFTAAVVDDIKAAVKWCTIWYILKYYEIILSPDDYDTATTKVTLSENYLTIGAGGDPTFLSFFLSKVSYNFYGGLNQNGLYKNSSDIISYIKEYTPIKNRDKFVAISVTPGFVYDPKNPIYENYFSKLISIKFAGAKTHYLQSVIVGRSGHATSYTFCNGTWRYYDNKAPKTTFSSSYQSTASNLNNILNKYNQKDKYNIDTKNIVLIYRIHALRGRSLKRKNHKVNKTRKNAQ